jgi:hypothetical protein
MLTLVSLKQFDNALHEWKGGDAAIVETDRAYAVA